MCGRIVQKAGPLDYAERIFTNLGEIFADPVGPRFNIPPGTRPLTMHRLDQDAESMARLPRGYKRSDSKHFMVNAKLETVQKNGWPWRFLIWSGRILVPVDGSRARRCARSGDNQRSPAVGRNSTVLGAAVHQ